MSDSVDRVFVHALNTVKRIPRLGTQRPPPSERLKLYGLYKQSMEGDVSGVLPRPQGKGDEVRSDQQKWDAWNRVKGLSRTEAKRRYITTLIDTMHQYASNTPDARELVSELEFVWDQIKSNPPSSSSSHSYNHHAIPGLSPESGPSSSQPIYPVMSEHGARNPGDMRLMNPSAADKDGELYSEDADAENPGREEFVDAPDSQIAPEEDFSQDHSELSDPSQQQQPPKERDKTGGIGAAAGAAANLMAPIANYLRSQATQYYQSHGSNEERWHKRIETALIKMNAEMAALREQIEMMQEADMQSSILRPFRRASFSGSGNKQGLVSWLFGKIAQVGMLVLKHIVVDAAILAVVTLFLHYKGIPPDRVEKMIYSWVSRLQQITFVRRLERTTQRAARQVVPKASLKSLGFSARQV